MRLSCQDGYAYPFLRTAVTQTLNIDTVVRARGRGGVVADNLQRLIGDQSVNSWAKAHHLDQPTVRRILIGEMSPTEQTITKIANATGLVAWQLLVPGLDPKSPPVLKEASQAERELYEKIRSDLEALQNLRQA